MPDKRSKEVDRPDKRSKEVDGSKDRSRNTETLGSNRNSLPNQIGREDTPNKEK